MKKYIALFLVLLQLLVLPVYAGTEEANLLANGDFEDGGGWTALESYPGNLDVVTDVKKSGNASLRITNTDTIYEVGQTLEGLTPGAVYEFKAYASAQGGSAVLARCVANCINAPDGYTPEYAQITISGSAWMPISYKISPPAGCTSIRFYIRNFSKNTVLWYDDVSVTKIEDVRAFDMVPSQVFYYNDTTDTPEIKVEKTEFFTPLGGDTIDFTLSDGEKILSEKRNVSFTAGTASFSFPFSHLTEEKKAYTVQASLIRNGITIYEKTQNVYKYPRPAILDKKGDVYIEGKRFLPKVALACNSTSYYESLKKAGFNAVTVYSGHLKGALPYLEQYNLKAIVPLYASMYPAGHPMIRADMAKIVEEYKDSDLVLGWQPMDEPGMNLSRLSYDELMEASYKMIRDIDDKHPVLLVDADENLYHKHAWYSDVLLCDAYTAYGGRDYTAEYVIRNMELAVKEANGKPVWYISGTFERDGYFMNADEYRNVMWQSFFAGGRGYGVYPIINVYKQGGTGAEKEGNLPDAALWKDMLDIAGRGEMELAFRHFVEEKTVPIGKHRGDTVWWETWYDNGAIYAVILNRKNTTQTVDIPLEAENGAILVENGRANRADGKTSKKTVKNGAFPVSLTAYEAAIYKVSVPLSETGIIFSHDDTEISTSAVVLSDAEEDVMLVTVSYAKKDGAREIVDCTAIKKKTAPHLPIVIEGESVLVQENVETEAFLWTVGKGMRPLAHKRAA